jgi:hypothetical protein
VETDLSVVPEEKNKHKKDAINKDFSRHLFGLSVAVSWYLNGSFHVSRIFLTNRKWKLKNRFFAEVIIDPKVVSAKPPLAAAADPRITGQGLP